MALHIEAVSHDRLFPTLSRPLIIFVISLDGRQRHRTGLGARRHQAEHLRDHLVEHCGKGKPPMRRR